MPSIEVELSDNDYARLKEIADFGIFGCGRDMRHLAHAAVLLYVQEYHDEEYHERSRKRLEAEEAV